MNSVLEKISSEPFRLFFPLGVVCGLLAVLFWPIKVFSLGWQDLSSKVHSHLQIYGFLFAFIIGFLSTAVPRLTKTKTFSLAEVIFLLADFVAIQVFIFKENYFLVSVLFSFAIVVLVLILGRRFLARKRNPPHTFVFIPFAILSAFVGSLANINLHLKLIEVSAPFYDLGNRLIYQSFIIFLLLGVGGFLIRSILGWGQSLPEGQNDPLVLPPENKRSLLLFAAVSVILFGSFVVENNVSRLIRAILITFILLFQIKIHRKAISGKLTAWTLQIALWLLLVGCWSVVFAPVEYAIDILHFCYIGGFSLSTFAVATRVILSHCNYSKLLGQRYFPFTVAVTLMIFGFLTRISVIFMPEFYYHHLAYAALLWFSGVIVWIVFILFKAIRDTLNGTV